MIGTGIYGIRTFEKTRNNVRSMGYMIRTKNGEVIFIDGGNGFNTGIWDSVKVRGWLDEIGVENKILAFEGD